ncbi:MAG: PAS domain S-box protein [Crenarchaeota archaeon]|nr:PAS domain S-box protein [Thermoproteota archaeon]
MDKKSNKQNNSSVRKNPIEILFVDNNPKSIETALFFLEKNKKFNIKIAHNTQEALEEINQNNIDIIISDYELPGKNGLKILEELNAKKNIIPFILLTEKNREETSIKALSLGATGYVDKKGKPEIVFDELTHYINQIIEKIEAKNALIEKEKQLERIIQYAPIGIATMKYNFQFLSANNEFCKIIGYEHNEISNLSFKDITFKEDLSDCLKRIENLCSGKVQLFKVEKRCIRKDGQIIIGRVVATTLSNQKGNSQIFIIQLEDITEIKEKNKELEENRQKFEILFKENPAAICIINTDFIITDHNLKFTELFGYTSEECIGKNVLKLIIPEEERKEIENSLENSKGHTIKYSGVRINKKGKKINVSISAGPIFKGEKKTGYMAVYNDITDLILAKEKANKALEETLSAQQKLESTLKNTELLNDKLNVIGSFTRHDVRNKLVTINGNAYLAKKQIKNNPELLSNIEYIEAASRSIVRILEFSKAYESLGNQVLTDRNVGRAIEEAITLFPDIKGIKIINQCNEIIVKADKMLTTIFNNLIDNSLKYGKIITKIKIYPKQTTEGKLKIIYEDDGEGISQEIKKRLFEKGIGKGTGYGLYLVMRTCDIYGWKVKETGKPGKGAKFEFTIP